MESDAVAQVFAIPELLTYIISLYCEDENARTKTPFPLALVARSWVDHALSGVWSEMGNECLRRLEAMPVLRRQYYADKILGICLYDSMEFRHVVPRLSIVLRNLTSLELHGSAEMYDVRHIAFPPAEAWAPVLLSPRLRHLRIGDPDLLAPDLALHIPEDCVELRTLNLRMKDQEASFELLVNLIQRSPRLRAVEIMGLSSTLASKHHAALVSALSRLSNLEKVVFYHDQLPDFAEAPALARLRSVQGILTERSLRRIATLMPSLTDVWLFLRANWTVDMVVSCLLGLLHLRTLEICIPGFDSIRRRDLVPLTQLHGLTALKLALPIADESLLARHRLSLKVEHLLSEVCPSMPNLTSLLINLGTVLDLTSRGLASLGAGCRRIEVLDLSGDLDVVELADTKPTPLFPRLHYLALGCIWFGRMQTTREMPQSQFEELISAIRKQFPYVYNFNLLGESSDEGLDTRIEQRLQADGWLLP